MKKALFAGSFDPFTKGHLDILEQSKKLCDHITILVAISPDKKSFFNPTERVKMIEDLFQNDNQVSVDKCDGIVVDYAREKGIDILIRGLRNANDLHVEQQLAEVNKMLAPNIQTVLLMCDPKLQHISSTYVRELLKYKKEINEMVPQSVSEYISNRG
jgi:pantetheine-phosphate adenylyltransferase